MGVSAVINTPKQFKCSTDCPVMLEPISDGGPDLFQQHLTAESLVRLHVHGTFLYGWKIRLCYVW